MVKVSIEDVRWVTQLSMIEQARPRGDVGLMTSRSRMLLRKEYRIATGEITSKMAVPFIVLGDAEVE